MGGTRALSRHDAPVRILNRELRLHDPEARPLLHALEHGIYSRPPLALHAVTQRRTIILLTGILLNPAAWNLVVLCVSVEPAYLVIGSSPECFLAKAPVLFYSPEEIHQIVGPRQRREASPDDNAVKAVIGETN
jgi:hypothetical protein